jgi:dimethylaniline monooxygenase (N-oxide forming)
LRIFWQNATGGFLNQADFFQVVAQNVAVHISDIRQISKGLVKLESGEDIPTDAILCGTGWKSSLQYFEESVAEELGLPFDLEKENPKSKEMWTNLEKQADIETLKKFPQLASPPAHYHSPVTTTPYRLYRHIAPTGKDCQVDDCSIVFLGFIDVANSFLVALCQAMWATAYLDRKLKMPDTLERRRSVASFRAWCRRRYLSRGEVWNNMTFELLGYTDSLLADLGLESHLKGWFKYWMAPVTVADFKDLEDEYVGKYGKD